MTAINHLSLQEQSEKLFPDDLPYSSYNRSQWLKAVNYLRTQSKTGWILDKRVEKK